MKRPGEMSYGFASNLRDALPNASFIGLTTSLPSPERPAANAAHCLFASLRSPSGQLLASCPASSPPVQSPSAFGAPDCRRGGEDDAGAVGSAVC